MSDIPDVDIDVADRETAAALFDHAIPASQFDHSRGKLVKHASGLYFQNIPRNPLNGLAAFSYDDAENFGYYKFDILSNSVYKNFASQDELHQLLEKPIDWRWFEHADFVEILFQFSDRWSEMVAKYAPQSILDLACLLAVVRPAKLHLIGEQWDVIHREMWHKPTDGKAYYKKPHAVAYAIVVGIDARLKAPRYFTNEMAG